MNVNTRIPTSELTHMAQGFLMGGADVIPGVSGGTVAAVATQPRTAGGLTRLPALCATTNRAPILPAWTRTHTGAAQAPTMGAQAH